MEDVNFSSLITDLSKHGLYNPQTDIPTIIIVGPAKSGKSTILRRLLGGEFASDKCKVYLSAFGSVVVDYTTNTPSFDEARDRPFVFYRCLRLEINSNEKQSAEPWVQASQPDKPLHLIYQAKPDPSSIFPSFRVIEISCANAKKPEDYTEDMLKGALNEVMSTIGEECPYVICAVCQASVDVANSIGLKLALSLDPLRKKTVGLLTMVDTLTDADWIETKKIINNEVFDLPRGWFVAPVHREAKTHPHQSAEWMKVRMFEIARDKLNQKMVYFSIIKEMMEGGSLGTTLRVQTDPGLESIRLLSKFLKGDIPPYIGARKIDQLYGGAALRQIYTTILNKHIHDKLNPLRISDADIELAYLNCMGFVSISAKGGGGGGAESYLMDYFIPVAYNLTSEAFIRCIATSHDYLASLLDDCVKCIAIKNNHASVTTNETERDIKHLTTCRTYLGICRERAMKTFKMIVETELVYFEIDNNDKDESSAYHVSPAAAPPSATAETQLIAESQTSLLSPVVIKDLQAHIRAQILRTINRLKITMGKLIVRTFVHGILNEMADWYLAQSHS